MITGVQDIRSRTYYTLYYVCVVVEVWVLCLLRSLFMERAHCANTRVVVEKLVVLC